MRRRWVGRLLPVLIVPVLLAVGACGGGGGTAPTPASTATVPVPAVTVLPSPTAGTLEDQIMAAYLAYWDRYAAALLHLDENLVSNVASGEEATRIRDEISQLRQQGVASRVVVKHNPAVLQASATSAIVYDEITNNSFYVDPQTLQPPTAAGSGNTLKDTFFLEKVNGQWTVARSARQN